MEITLLVALCRATQLEKNGARVQPLAREGAELGEPSFHSFLA